MSHSRTARERHRDFYLTKVKNNPEDWQSIEKIYGQIKRAWEFAPDNAPLADFQDTIDTYQDRRGLWSDQIDWNKRLLRLAQEQGRQVVESKARNNLGVAYDHQGKWKEAIQMFQENLLLARLFDDIPGEGTTLNNLGNVYNIQGKWEEAIRIFQGSLRIYRQLGDSYSVSIILSNLANIYDQQGQWEEAIKMFQDGLVIERQVGDSHGVCQILNNLGQVYAKQGRWDDGPAGAFERKRTVMNEKLTPQLEPIRKPMVFLIAAPSEFNTHSQRKRHFATPY